MNELYSPFIHQTAEKWHFTHFTFLILLVIIITLFFLYIRVKKSIKNTLIDKHILSQLQNHLQSITFRCNVDTNFSITYVSENILACIGYSSKSIMNDGEAAYRKLIHPEDLKILTNAVNTCSPVKKNYQAEYRIRTKWGAEKWILEQGVGIFDKKGDLKFVEGVLTDTTNDKFSVEFLQESEKRFQVLIEHAPVGICIFYNDMITFVNPVFLNMFGPSSIQEFLGSSLLNCIAHDERESIARIIDKHNQGLQPRTGYETIGMRKDGSQFFLQIFLTKVNLGDFEATLAYFIDTTKYKLSEENLLSLNQRLNDIIDLIPDPTFVVDKDKRIIHWNKATEELTGVKKEEILGKGDYTYAIPFYGRRKPMLLDLVDMDDKEIEKTYSYIKRVKDKVYGEFSGSIVSRKGQTYLWGVAAPLLDSNGNRFGTIEVIKDITEAKTREMALAESEKKARTVIDTNQGIIVLLKPDGTILDCNEHFSTVHRKSRNEIIGTNIGPVLSEELRQLLAMFLSKVLETGETMTFEFMSDGSSAYYSNTIYPVKDADNEIKSLVVYATNITELKKAEKALKESEEKYRTITESISDYLYKVIIENNTPRFVFDNPGCEKIVGYTIHELKNNPSLFYDIVLEEDKQTVNSYLQIIAGQKTSKTIEHRITHKNGKTVWISNTLIFYKENTDGVVEINGVIKDITIRKHFEHALQEAEERYRSVFDQSGLASNVFDLSGKLIMQNEQAEKLLGGHHYDLIGKTLEEIFSPEIALEARQVITQTLQKGAVIEERKITLPSGKYWLKTISHAIRNSSDEVIGVQFISQDVTEKKELDHKILNTIINTEEKERMNFAQELHDGLGPLISAIKMYVQWLSRPDAKVSQSEILTDIEQLIGNASQTIKEISFKLSPHVLDNFGLIEAINTYAEKIKLSKGIDINITSNFPDRLDKTIETILYRILCECCNNTLKHANATKISLKFLKLDNNLKITYHDNGIGFMVENVLNMKTGNGLFNMQSRLQTISGSIDINSKPGAGTKITITVKL